jgi:hypothetical protein
MLFGIAFYHFLGAHALMIHKVDHKIMHARLNKTRQVYDIVPRMYALFFHRLSILERDTDHKCIEECSYSKKEYG